MLSRCDDEKDGSTIPRVNTSAVTDVTTTTATGGGEITDDGNATVKAKGLVYSSTNATPTTMDDKTEVAGAGSIFESPLTNLVSGTTYYVRAYATNKVGTAYGDVVQFTTGNAPPTVGDIAITGELEVNKTLTVTYTYDDAEGDEEAGTIVHWLVAEDAVGSEAVTIEGATSLSYKPEDAQEFKYIAVEISPGAATGTQQGIWKKSAFVGPINVRTTITFAYNGEDVTCGIITSSATGRKWLDRNLGAGDVPSAFDDWKNYGDLFQWGRSADGHQLIERSGGTNSDVSGVETTTEPASGDRPTHALFIINSAAPNDWSIPSNDNRWQGVSGINNPCPPGWRVPTESEWLAENIANRLEGYDKLKLTASGMRSISAGGIFQGASTNGQYWSSTLVEGSTSARVWGFRFNSSSITAQPSGRGLAMSCRCIKD